MGATHNSSVPRKSNDTVRLTTVYVATILGAVFGFIVGLLFPSVGLPKIFLPPSIVSSLDVPITNQNEFNRSKPCETLGSGNVSNKVYVPTNPRGAELLPPGIVVSESDFYLRRLWGDPNEDLKKKTKYLVAFAVCYDQRETINAAVEKFSDDFQILLFHYDGLTSEWDQFDWSKRAIHVSVRRQTKWWYAKRFLHPDVVAAYEYIFIWDEDLGVERFNGTKYIEVVKKYGLEISQPALDPSMGVQYLMTMKKNDSEAHKYVKERPNWCTAPTVPPCVAFVEIMAPVFSREAWRCVWHMIQNDLVHGWGLDFSFRRCFEHTQEKIGVVDSQWIIHQAVPSLNRQGKSEDGKAPGEGVRARCQKEMSIFFSRLDNADKAYISQNRTR